MTSFEVWKYLISSCGNDDGMNDEKKELKFGLNDVIKRLDSEELAKYIDEYWGFYFLKGRQSLVDERLRRNKVSEGKFRIIRKVGLILRFVPFVKMIGVTGRMAMKNAKRKSDLDLFIVVKEGKIFTGRFLLTGLVHLIGKRRYKNKVADRICLNYFVAADSCEIMIKDLFASSEYSFMIPIFGNKEFLKFLGCNGWMKEYHPNCEMIDQMNHKLLEDSWLSSRIRNLGEMIFGFDFIERHLGEWQKKRIENDPRTKKEGSMVFADNGSLIFLPDPQGPRIFEMFKKKIKDIG